jgi:hypothetical protein
MNQLGPVTVEHARLPQTYANAKSALYNCVSIDECQSWADKAMALASYAKQADDDELMKMATRIRDRAIRRAGELLKQIPPQRGKRTDKEPAAGGDSKLSRGEVAAQAGMSERQQVTAVRVANVPADQFEKAVESDEPPTVTKLAAMGTKPAPRPVIDLKGRDPDEFNRSLHFVAEFEDYAKAVAAFDLDVILPALTPPEVSRVRNSIATIDAVHDRIITRI